MNLMQRLVISNLFGFAFVVLSWIVIILIYEAWKGRVLWAFPWLLGSLLLVVLDVGYRAIRSSQTRGNARSGSNLWRSIVIQEPLGCAVQRRITSRLSRVGSRNLVRGRLCGTERS